MSAMGLKFKAAKAEFAHLLRANIAKTRKPGHFLYKLCEVISPKTTHFHRSSESTVAHVSLNTRNLSISSEDTQPVFKQPAYLQAPLNQSKMAKARQWAESQIKDKDNLEFIKIGTVALREVEKENSERTLALFERALTVASNPDEFKGKLQQFLQGSRLPEAHNQQDITDAQCALELAYNQVTSGGGYPQVEMMGDPAAVKMTDPASENIYEKVIFPPRKNNDYDNPQSQYSHYDIPTNNSYDRSQDYDVPKGLKKNNDSTNN